MSTDPTLSSAPGSQLAKLVNGIELTGSASGKLKMDLTDPVAVLALKLVADGSGAVRQRAAKRAGLLQQLQSLVAPGADLTALQRPDAIPKALADLANRSAEAGNKATELRTASAAATRELADLTAQVTALSATRASYAAVLWWFGIGWLLWKFSGKQPILDRVAAEAEAERGKLAEAERGIAAIEARIGQYAKQDAVLRQIGAIDAQPIELLRRFGWSHVPLQIAPGATDEDRLVFTTLWAKNFSHEFPHIKDGIRQVEALRTAVLSSGKLPVLLSPTTDEHADLRGLMGEELVLAKNIDTFAALSASATNTTVEATMLPADAAIDSHLGRWATAQELPANTPVCLAVPDRQRIEGLTSLLRQVSLEEQDPEANLAKRLEAVASSLRDRTEDFANKRSESIEGLMGNILSEWSSWSMLPLRRRYCPSFHKSPQYRYARLGFVLEQVFDERGAFMQGDKIGRLPDPHLVERQISDYTAAWQKGGQRPEGLESRRADILKLISSQVEGTKIITLSPSARLNYNLVKRQWQCGLCTHEPRIGGPDSPESHIGCPKNGLFTDQEATMAEQYVQFEDLLIPMLTNLWNEKSTHDEVNRIVREKESELRRNVLEEQQSLRDEARIFKEAARDRIVGLEEMKGQAKELIERFRAEIHAALALGALDGPRQHELETQARENEHQVGSIGEIVLNARNLEDGLAADVDATLASRDIVLEERIRRSSDAPQFVHLPPAVGRRTLTAGTAGFLLAAGGTSKRGDALLVRSLGDSSIARRTPEEIGTWLADDSNLAEAQKSEVNDGMGWTPLLQHPKISALLTRTGGAAGSPPPLPGSAKQAPPLPEVEQ